MSTRNRYRALYTALGMTQTGAARFLDVGPRTSRRWAKGDVPLMPIMLLEIMLAHGITPHEARRLAKRAEKHATYSDRRLSED